VVKNLTIIIMIKTNLEIREEFYNHFPIFAEKCRAVNEEVADWWLSKFQQRMDEIEGEAEKLSGVNIENRDGTTTSLVDKSKVLNIIKSVDKK